MENKIPTITNSRWDRKFHYGCQQTKAFFTITTENFIIKLTGGSVIILNKKTKEKLKKITGYNYLYTGDVKPDETELFALENGKHFYIISLEDFTQKLKVTLPRSYEALDVYGSFSDDGKFLYVPVHKWSGNGYEIYLCAYETENYTLLDMKKQKTWIMGWH